MSREARRLPYIRCPHCGAKAFARVGGKTSETYREVYYHCSNEIECGHVFVVAMQVIRTVHPSLMPNPMVHLPITPPANLRRHAANENDPCRSTARAE